MFIVDQSSLIATKFELEDLLNMTEHAAINLACISWNKMRIFLAFERLFFLNLVMNLIWQMQSKKAYNMVGCEHGMEGVQKLGQIP